ncbi:MAG TPA: protein kinase, partial [Lacipirellulaceae bacterium]
MNQAAADAKSIFLKALDCQTPEELASFLETACDGGRQLRARVNELLDAHRAAGNFLHGGGGGETNAFERIAERPGTVIGPYKLLQQIGEGGMGVVFMAEQERPVRRRVALKIIKPGMDTQQVIARFEAERQALAMMDHSNIAKVHDAGATDNGRPYFVMELVQGVPITDYCDQCHLTTRQRLELFTTVCQAVQHAHQKGVIHRDIKPTNVLVAIQDGQPAPKIIDFGVAKALNDRLTENTLATSFAQMLGTPMYMSPEQAELSPLGADTRSDIYSLGVLLYELLTSTTPFDKDRLHAASYDEFRRIIREEDPPRPSARLSTLAAELATTVADHQRSEPRRLLQALRGELDWIVMKSLDKDRNRRYESASALAGDVLHYLRDEPITAAAPSRFYRASKFVRRNKWPVTTATALALAVLVAVVTLAVTNMMIRQEQARTKDEKERAEVAQKLAENRAEEIRQQMERLKQANALLDRGQWYVSKHRWHDAHAAFTRAIEMRPDHVSSWVQRGDLHTRLGLWDLAAADYARELGLREPDTTLRWFQHALLCLHVGDTDGYYQSCRKMRQRFRGTLNASFVEECVRSSLLLPDQDVDLARNVELAQKVAIHPPWSGLYILGFAHFRAGQYEQAIQRLDELAAQSQWPIRFLRHPIQAMAYHHLGRSDEAQRALREAGSLLDQWTQERYEGQEEEHWVHHQGAAAVWLIPWWDYLEGQLTYREAKMLIDGSPPPADARLLVLRARAFAGLRSFERASAEYDTALKLSPNDPQIRLESHRSQGYGFVRRGQWEKAADQFTKACQIQPDDAYLWRFQAVARFASGNLVAYRQTCTDMFERFKTAEGGATTANVLLACLLREDSLPDMAQLLPLAQLAEPIWHWGTWARGAALYRAGRYEESVRCFEAAAQTYRPRAWDWCFLAMAHQRLEHNEDARRCLNEAARWIDEANKEEMDDLTGTHAAWGDWHERVVYPILLREAEQLMSVEAGVSEQEQ